MACVFDVGFLLSRGNFPHWDYLLLYVALSLAAALIAAVVRIGISKALFASGKRHYVK